MKNNLNYRLLTKKHSFWESLDDSLKVCLLAISIASAISVIPFGLGSIPSIQKIICYLSPDCASLIQTFWGRYGIGWLSLIFLVLGITIGYPIVFGLITMLHVFVAKLILSVRYTRLPLTEQEFNETFKDKDIVETMQILSKYTTFKRRCILPWVTDYYIEIRNKHSNEIYKKLHLLIYKRFKNMSANEWLKAFDKATGCYYPYLLASTDNKNAFWKCFKYTFNWPHNREKLKVFLVDENI